VKSTGEKRTPPIPENYATPRYIIACIAGHGRTARWGPLSRTPLGGRECIPDLRFGERGTFA
jgi:hypothetical protein